MQPKIRYCLPTNILSLISIMKQSISSDYVSNIQFTIILTSLSSLSEWSLSFWFSYQMTTKQLNIITKPQIVRMFRAAYVRLSLEGVSRLRYSGTRSCVKLHM
jgi:hypothetical protein